MRRGARGPGVPFQEGSPEITGRLATAGLALVLVVHLDIIAQALRPGQRHPVRERPGALGRSGPGRTRTSTGAVLTLRLPHP